MSDAKYQFDEEQEFFVDLRNEEMYHTEVVETLNALLAVVRAINETKASEVMFDTLGYDLIDKALAALPEHLRGDNNERSRKA